VTTNLLFYLN